MKAAQINDYGDINKVVINEIDQPKPGDEQVLVKVEASSLNPFDTMIREGYMKDNIPLKLPVTLGGDIAGTIQEVGSRVTNFKVGDKVYGQANVVAGNSGAFAEFTATKATQVGLAPKNISIEEAASIPLVGVSALQAITEHIKLAKDQKIFINGGSGAIGQIAIQIAKNIGAYVATTATREGIEQVKKLGADQVIDYKKENYQIIVKDFDAVFDTVGGPALENISTLVKDGGVVVSMVGQPKESANVTCIAQMTSVTTEKLNQLTDLIEKGIVTPNVGKTFKLDQIQEAFQARESGKVFGKIVIEIKE